MTSRRRVRVTLNFFDRLDELLGDERSEDGHPSATDFLLHDLPPIIEQLATAYEDTTVEIGPNMRLLVTAVHFAPIVAVYTTLADDGDVELIYLEMGEPPDSFG